MMYTLKGRYAVVTVSAGDPILGCHLYSVTPICNTAPQIFTFLSFRLSDADFILTFILRTTGVAVRLHVFT